MGIHNRQDAELLARGKLAVADAPSGSLAIFEYINGFYNPRRRHSAPGWKSPLVFEALAA